MIGIFHNLAPISGKTDRTFTVILPKVHLWAENSPLNFGTHPDPNQIRIY